VNEDAGVCGGCLGVCGGCLGVCGGRLGVWYCDGLVDLGVVALDEAAVGFEAVGFKGVACGAGLRGVFNEFAAAGIGLMNRASL
jgi:hypothetical protein